MENNKYYVSTADLIKLMNDVMNADKKSASEIIGIDEELRDSRSILFIKKLRIRRFLSINLL